MLDCSFVEGAGVTGCGPLSDDADIVSSVPTGVPTFRRYTSDRVYGRA
jgi:hypothetical protein